MYDNHNHNTTPSDYHQLTSTRNSNATTEYYQFVNGSSTNTHSGQKKKHEHNTIMYPRNGVHCGRHPAAPCRIESPEVFGSVPSSFRIALQAFSMSASSQLPNVEATPSIIGDVLSAIDVQTMWQLQPHSCLVMALNTRMPCKFSCRSCTLLPWEPRDLSASSENSCKARS